MNINEYISSGIIEMYVMGLCTSEEKTELELLRKQQPEVNAAILNFEKQLENNLLNNTALPNTQTDKKILESFAAMQTPVVNMQQNSIATKKTNWYKFAAAAGLVLFLGSAIFNYTSYQKIKAQQTTIANNLKNTTPTLPESDYKILTQPNITPVAMYGQGYHAICRCTMFWDKATGKAYMMIHHLVNSGSGKDYQLWAMVNGKPVSVGLVNDEIRGKFIELTNVPANATSFNVTLENAGGSKTVPSDDVYLSGKI
jgi:anti-sigma-K factor RskA